MMHVVDFDGDSGSADLVRLGWGNTWPDIGYLSYRNVTPRTVPSSSHIRNFDVGDASVTLFFAAPLATGANPITSFSATCSSVALGVGVVSGVATTSPVVVQGLTNGKSYSCADRAHNAAGVSLPSPSVKVRPAVAASAVAVVEFYNASLDHYFITYVADEIAKLDNGTFKGWARTGLSFKAYASTQSGTSPVCRIYIPPGKGDGHFFGRDSKECDGTISKNPTFILESGTFFYLYPPTLGNCGAGQVAVYRVFSNRADANHRYTTDRAVRDQMVGKGWLAEGDGADTVVMCAPT